jgi:hypothetical protein
MLHTITRSTAALAVAVASVAYLRWGIAPVCRAYELGKAVERMKHAEAQAARRGVGVPEDPGQQVGSEG